jgi:hypothetical protein
MSTTEQATFIEDLITQYPGLQPLYAEHIHDNDELLPSVFCFQVVGYLVDLASYGSPEKTAELRSMLEFLEHAFTSSGPSCRELISVAVIEDLPRPGERGAIIRMLLGPEMAADLQLHINRD